ncbi:MAG TPA: CHAD domain-containing protein [Chloroflexota bacterium]|nr:CHAD domain-containing protein [Chloroflexota bacterium]
MSSAIDELYPRMPFSDAALPVIQDRLAAVADNEGGTRAGTESEPLHDMRVASRRLRAALEAFRDCFPRSEYRPVEKMARALTHGLGVVRDLDVLMAEARRLAAKATPEEYAGIELLIAHLEGERAKARPAMLKVLDELRERGFRHRVLSLARNPRDHGGTLQAHARRQAIARLADLYGYAPTIHDETRDKELHQMRIEAKHLRYCLEIFRVCFGSEIEQRITDIKAIQDKIGQIHDCDVLVELARSQGIALAGRQFDQLTALAGTPMNADTRRSTLRAALIPPEGADPRLGILVVLGKKLEERHTRYTGFTQWWDEQDDTGLRGKLYACLNGEDEPEESE